MKLAELIAYRNLLLARLSRVGGQIEAVSIELGEVEQKIRECRDQTRTRVKVVKGKLVINKV